MFRWIILFCVFLLIFGLISPINSIAALILAALGTNFVAVKVWPKTVTTQIRYPF